MNISALFPVIMHIKKIIKSFLLISILILNIDTAVCQNLKTYSGSFDGTHTSGFATYHYFEKDYKRIWSGSFNYSEKSKKITVSGKYVNNLKNGYWKANVYNYYYDGWLADYWITSSLTGQYINGNRTGKWILSKKVTGKIGSFTKLFAEGLIELFGTKEKISEKATKVESSTVNFFNNHLTGNFSYNSYISGAKNSKVTLKGSFDILGQFIGTWEYKSHKYQEIRKYNKGVLYWLLKRDRTTGEILKQIDNSTFVNQFFEQYDSISNSAFINNTLYVLEKSEDIDEYKEIGLWEKETYTKYGGITDGIYLYEILYGSFDTLNIFTERQIIKCFNTYDFDCEDKIKKLRKEYELKLAYKNAINKADSLFLIKQFKESIAQYAFALDIKYDSLTYNQIVLAKDILFYKHITLADSLFLLNEYELAIIEYSHALVYKMDYYTEKQISKIIDIKYNNCISIADSLFLAKNYDLAISEYQNALKVKDESYPKNRIEEIKLIKFLKEREQAIYPYKDFHPDHFIELENTLLNELKALLIALNISIETGLNFNYRIDTVGKTSFLLKSSTSLDRKFQIELENIGRKYELKPVEKNNYLLNANAEYSFPVVLNSKNFSVKITASSTQIQNEPTPKQNTKIIDAVSGAPNGKFKIRLEEKKINNIDFSQTRILSFKGSGGPSNAFLSMLLPGLGDPFVYKENNETRLWYYITGLFLGSASFAFANYNDYINYKPDSTSSSGYSFSKGYVPLSGTKKTKGDYKTSFLIYGSIASAIWLGDVICVAVKGFKNQKESKKYKSKIGLAYIPNSNSYGLTYSLNF